MTDNRANGAGSLLAQLDGLNTQELKRLLVENLTWHKLGLYWESSAIERDAAHKATRIPAYYRKVLFLTQDRGRFCVVNDDDSVGRWWMKITLQSCWIGCCGSVLR